MTMELEYTRVESFEVKGIRFTCDSKWNGMEEGKWQCRPLGMCNANTEPCDVQ